MASETAALDIVGAQFVREVEPGELISIDSGGVASATFAPAQPRGCLFEYVYLARPDTTIAGRGVQATRVEVGRRLAAEHPAEADLVIPVPESGTPAAIGYAQASGIPYGQGLVKNSYVGRTFIQPSQTIRERGIRLKLNPLRDVIAGKRIVVVDDSIVRGNTQRAIVGMLREAGAAEVHVRISEPSGAVAVLLRDRLRHPRRTDRRQSRRVEQIRESIGADSLGFVSLAALTEATTLPAHRLCRACFDGDYPVPVAEAERGKHVLEGAAAAGVRPRACRPGSAPPPRRHRAPRPGSSRSADGAGRQTGRPRGGWLNYQAAGVGIGAGDRAVALMPAAVARTGGRRCVGGIGGFACRSTLPAGRLPAPSAGHLHRRRRAPRW